MEEQVHRLSRQFPAAAVAALTAGPWLSLWVGTDWCGFGKGLKRMHLREGAAIGLRYRSATSCTEDNTLK